VHPTTHRMKKTVLLFLALTGSFVFGYAFNNFFREKDPKELKRVTGIGGIFFKCKDPKQLREWYKTHLGLNTNDYGSVFEWEQGADSTKKGYTQWSPFSEKSKYFDKEIMINYRVADLDALVTELKKENVTIVDTVATYSYGKFVHILDNEGNKVELWEPYDTEFGKMGTTTK
jgi:predicted enzyme related to lactoylglutathione lyase